MSHENPENPDVSIDDPEELSQTKRINELLNRRKAVIDSRDEAFDVQLLGEASREEALAYYRSRIESLIVDLWTLFQNDDFDAAEQYLKTEHIDTVHVSPPEKIGSDGGLSLAPWESQPDPKPVHIRGLEWFITNGPTISRDFTVELWDPPGSQTVTNEIAVPAETLDQALTKCIEFMDKMGVDADLTEEEQQTYIDRELLEEVEEWRQENVEA